MLFNSFIFLFAFLPIALLLTYGAGRFRTLCRVVLTALSLIFYAWWRPQYLIILVGSIVFNYLVGGQIQNAYLKDKQKSVNLWLAFGVIVDVALLGWFKYANFAVDNINFAFGADIHLAHIALPLAISFFTFQKIAYLVDSARGQARRISLLDFALFASFFPPLIAGPITHYKEIVPQLNSRRFGRLIGRNILVGLAIFSIGLFKKTVIADTVAMFVNPLYSEAHKGVDFNILTGWLAAITYTFQLYFDFSGYSDMAIGLGRMFGIKIPLNFHSPLRAPSIIEYWRRWHMTLQRFIVSYIFQPLSIPMNRFAAQKGLSNWASFGVSIALPSLITFLISGIWHGAGWTFIVWGLMHGVYVCINQLWLERAAQRRRALRKLKQTPKEPSGARVVLAHIITLIAVLFGNVMFRASDIPDAFRIWRGMINLDQGPTTSAEAAMLNWGLFLSLIVCSAIVFLMPNTQQIMGRFSPAENWRTWKDVAPAPLKWTWRPSLAGLLFIAVLLFFGIMFIQRGQAVFLYFNF